MADTGYMVKLFVCLILFLVKDEQGLIISILRRFFGGLGKKESGTFLFW
jgi:hypothetical protein